MRFGGDEVRKLDEIGADSIQKPLEVIPIEPPPAQQRAGREAHFVEEGEKKSRYHMPSGLDSSSPIGYRHRVSFTLDEAQEVVKLLSLGRPKSFLPASEPVLERELFEETSLGILSSRQSTNYRGHKQCTVGPEDSETIAGLLRQLDCEGEVLDNATHTNLVFARPYRTPFTLLLTFIGHLPLVSIATVLLRAWRKRFFHVDDIPTVGYLKEIHIGILADAMERAALIASRGRRGAQVFMKPFAGRHYEHHSGVIREIERIGGLSRQDRAAGWRLAIVSQVGELAKDDRIGVAESTYEKLGANLLSLRSERIQPGVNQEEKAPSEYQERQDMDVPDELTVQSGRAAYNAFVHWTECGREASKQLLLLDRIDVLTPNGKKRLRQIREMLEDVADEVIGNIPLWADLPTGKALSRNAARGKKAFAMAGQRIYIGGLDEEQVRQAGLDWHHSIRAFGAASARSALYAELMGCVEIPDGCDLLAGICLMAGPVNQNDIGKSFYGQEDLLCSTFPQRDPTSLLVWTLKAKTVADPIGNEEQLLNERRKGALVDLRPGPDDVMTIKRGDSYEPMRSRAGRRNSERAFSSLDNFATAVDGREIPGNRGSQWPKDWSSEPIWYRSKK